MNGGIINYITRLHLVGYFYWVTLRLPATRCSDLESHTLLECYAAYSGNSLPTFRTYLLIPSCCPKNSERNNRHTLCDIPEERRSHALRCGSLKSRVSGDNWRDIRFVCTSPAVSDMKYNLWFQFCTTRGVTRFICYRPALHVLWQAFSYSFLCNTWKDFELVSFGPVSHVTHAVTTAYLFFDRLGVSCVLTDRYLRY